MTEPCPFCNATHLSLHGHTKYWLQCNTCLATGPIADSEASAEVVWNLRGTTMAAALAPLYRSLGSLRKSIRQAK